MPLKTRLFKHFMPQIRKKRKLGYPGFKAKNPNTLKCKKNRFKPWSGTLVTITNHHQAYIVSNCVLYRKSRSQMNLDNIHHFLVHLKYEHIILIKMGAMSHILMLCLNYFQALTYCMFYFHRQSKDISELELLKHQY